MADWKKYGKIVNANAKTWERAMEVPHDETWIAVEKIHGANFSFIVHANGDIQCAKRNSILSSDDNFYDHKEILAKYTPFVRRVAAQYPNTSIQIFGELFGGLYPGYDSEKFYVQKEVYYTPNVNFIPFDIWTGKTYEDWASAQKILADAGFRVLVPRCVGSLESVRACSHKFPSDIPKMFELPWLGDDTNFAEGLVIRPIHTYYTKRQRRIIYKHKISKFSEVRICISKPEKPSELKWTTEQNQLYDALTLYITKPRMDNLLSHGSASWDNLPRLAGLFTADVFSEFANEDEEIWAAVDKKSRGPVRKKIAAKCRDFILAAKE